MVPQLDAPEIPECVEFLLSIYIELAACRGGSGFGVNPITHLDILAWSHLNRIELTPWEVDALLAMDRAALAVIAEGK